MNKVTQALVAEVREIMTGRNAPNDLRISAYVKMIRSGIFLLQYNGAVRQMTEPEIDSLCEEDLRRALAFLRKWQIGHRDTAVS